MNYLRKLIARKLDPQSALDAEKYRRMIGQITNDIHWLNEFPVAHHTLERVIVTDRDYWRKLEEKSSSYLYSDISSFREFLRKMKQEQQNV